MRRNLDDWSLISFRPRVLRDVENIDMRRSVLGHDSQYPFFVSSMGTFGSAHPCAAFGLVKGIVPKGVHTVISTASSKTAEEIMQTLLDQQKGRRYKGQWITVDAPVLSKRNEDRYLQAQEALELGVEEEAKPFVKEAGGENSFAPAFGDLKWIREEWTGLVVLNPIRIYYPEVLSSIDVDGGLPDGADVLEALCLGDTAVGIGRPILYALAAYGAAGVEKCPDILAEELSIGMRLLGITSLDQVNPDLVNASRLLSDIWRPDMLPSRL
ncbi:hypothetical protein V501_05688 [Pseudogymnoascus sp. VKM F-4519 (FW-2642)]|nr:hypothetical protein V501_05688 [Pseudogymnoascus sp. VKM F-4519 (FW-2642)]